MGGGPWSEGKMGLCVSHAHLQPSRAHLLSTMPGMGIALEEF